VRGARWSSDTNPGRPARWTLSRAGIINVYQYGDETLNFGGVRLLLRGVNGSGKSTGMNMLLPFLLDADTRRIDAAGKQSGVLRAWMLSGRDEPQPQGYLWLEVAKGDSYLNFGCGIRVNRATDQVTSRPSSTTTPTVAPAHMPATSWGSGKENSSVMTTRARCQVVVAILCKSVGSSISRLSSNSGSRARKSHLNLQ
jgi:hypothetical protein